MNSPKNLDCSLLIDDDVIYNFLHKTLINNPAYKNHIETALNGQISLDSLSDLCQHPKDKDHPLAGLILLDINMPIMDG
jgi:CheY-like chemotaxis protein